MPTKYFVLKYFMHRFQPECGKKVDECLLRLDANTFLGKVYKPPIWMQDSARGKIFQNLENKNSWLKFNLLKNPKGHLILERLLNQKTNENISVFLPYLSKIGQIKKRMQIITLGDKKNH